MLNTTKQPTVRYRKGDGVEVWGDINIPDSELGICS